MPYADGRLYYDADSHIMELPDWLHDYADPGVRDRLPPIDLSTGGRMVEELERLEGRKAHSPETVAELAKNVIGGAKGYGSLGAFNREERAQALDLLGFAKQLVFSTFTPMSSFYLDDIELRYAACRANNRAMADFCADDARLMGVALVPLDDPERTREELDLALSLDLAGIWIPPVPCGGRSPGHPDFDFFWARLADAGVPFLLHVGGTPFKIDAAYWNNGKPLPEDWLGGGENIRSRDFTLLHQDAERFLSVMVLDGVFERHRALRGGVIELGATWVPGMLARLDNAAALWQRSEPDLAKFERKPSEQIRAQMGFTPYPFEDVGALINASHDDLYLFSSDYPHIEGGRDPLGRFERSLVSTSEETQERFYSKNFADLFGL